MNLIFYMRLAKTNIRKNAKHYVPFILTCIFTIMMFYLMCFIANNQGINRTGGAITQRVLNAIMPMGIFVIAIFAVLFLLYTNSFLIKQRKKEFALYHILGMEKKHIALMITLETAAVFFISLLAGFILGFIFSKLMVLFICQLLHFSVPYGFEISLASIGLTMLVFAAIFGIMLLNNLKQVYFTKTIALIKGANTGEKEPKARWLCTLIGIGCLGTGYYLAITTTSPIDAVSVFFLAVILVIIGTYLLFITGIVALLKVLKGNKAFYYKTKHFISVSSMMYRMKQNAAGLANICILSTMVLVMVSSTTSLYLGLDDMIKSRYPKNVIITITNNQVEDGGKLVDALTDTVIESAAKNDIAIDTASILHYSLCRLGTDRTAGNQFDILGPYLYNTPDFYALYFISLADYQRITGSTSSCAGDEVLFYAKDAFLYDSVQIGQKQFTIKEHLRELAIPEPVDEGRTFYVVIDDLQTVLEVYGDEMPVPHRFLFDSPSSAAEQIAFTDQLDLRILLTEGDSCSIASSAGSKMEFLALYGGLFFLGIFLGLLFITAAVLMIYYKQISEGYDDKKRFEIMQKVGMDLKEIKKSIRSQVLLVFFLPLLLAACHVAGAFLLISRILALFDMTNEGLFLLCTILCIVVFAVFYTAIYALTARTYYRIVK